MKERKVTKPLSDFITETCSNIFLGRGLWCWFSAAAKLPFFSDLVK